MFGYIGESSEGRIRKEKKVVVEKLAERFFVNDVHM